MKYRNILMFLILSTALLLSGFSGSSKQFQKPKKVVQDTVNRYTAFADSLGISPNLNLTLYKKNAHASYYHSKFNGKRTASGSKFNNDKYTAAHRKFPFGTKVKVTNEANGKSVIVTVTDRGPFTKGREIDLTRRAFMDIAANKNSGNLKVTIEVIK